MGNCFKTESKEEKIEELGLYFEIINNKYLGLKNAKTHKRFSSITSKNYTDHFDSEEDGKDETKMNLETIDKCNTNESEFKQYTNFKIEKNDKLILKIIDSKLMELGTEIKINCLGLEGNGLNTNLDENILGQVRFGSGHLLDNKNDIENGYRNEFDYHLAEEESFGFHHFNIKYDILSKFYTIKNENNSALFVKIQSKHLFHNPSIIGFGSNQMIVKTNNNLNSNTENSQTESQITFTINFGVNKDQEYSFQSSLNPLIKFGRKKSQGINIIFPDESTSRLQCTVSYENSNWYIVDSDGVNTSSNGTWFLADQEEFIKNNLIFRAGSNVFECKIAKEKSS